MTSGLSTHSPSAGLHGIPIASLIICLSPRSCCQSSDFASPEHSSKRAYERFCGVCCFSRQAMGKSCFWDSLGSVDQLRCVLPTPSRRPKRMLEMVACDAISQMVSDRLALSACSTSQSSTDRQRQTDNAWQGTVRNGIRQLEQNCEASATRVGRIKQ